MTIQINHGCRRKLYKWSNCSVCVSACHLQAIRVRDNDIFIDTKLCNECGQCVAVCPFNEIMGNRPEYHIKNNILYESQQLIPSLEELLLLKAYGIIEVRINSLSSKWRLVVEQVNSILKDNAKEIFHITISSEPIDEISYSRRALFRLPLFKKLILFDKEINNLALAYPGYQFYKIKLDYDKCNLCSLCEIHCHRGCIKIDKNKVVINTHNCDGCHLCKDICNEHALLITKGMQRLQIEEHTIYQRECSVCHDTYQSITNLSEYSICPKCTFRQNNKLPIYSIGQINM